VQLNTFHAPDNWYEGSQTELDAIWDNPQSVGKPSMLKSPDINDIHADATIEVSTSLIEKIALEAAWSHIVGQIYQQLCPNIVADLATVIQDIHQATSDDNGEKVILKVEAYFNAIQRMTNFLPKAETWTIDVVQHFIRHLIDDVRQQLSAIQAITTIQQQHRGNHTNRTQTFRERMQQPPLPNSRLIGSRGLPSMKSQLSRLWPTSIPRSLIGPSKNIKRRSVGAVAKNIPMPTAKGKSFAPTRTNQESSNKQQKRAKTTTIGSKIVKATRSAWSITTSRTP
jgi:hypothetical protein